MPNVSWILNFMLLCICIFLWFKPAGERPRQVYDEIKKIIKEQHDTILVLDTVLKYKIRTINEAPDSVVVYKIDSLYGNNAHSDTVFIERQLLICKDSLDIEILKDTINTETIMKIDSVVKVPDTKTACSLVEQAKSFGSGILVGAGIRSLF